MRQFYIIRKEAETRTEYIVELSCEEYAILRTIGNRMLLIEKESCCSGDIYISKFGFDSKNEAINSKREMVEIFTNDSDIWDSFHVVYDNDEDSDDEDGYEYAERMFYK